MPRSTWLSTFPMTSRFKLGAGVELDHLARNAEVEDLADQRTYTVRRDRRRPFGDRLDELPDIPVADLPRPQPTPLRQELVLDHSAVLAPRPLPDPRVLLQVEGRQRLEGRGLPGVLPRLRGIAVARDLPEHLPGAPSCIGEGPRRIPPQRHPPVAPPGTIAHDERPAPGRRHPHAEAPQLQIPLVDLTLVRPQRPNGRISQPPCRHDTLRHRPPSAPSRARRAGDPQGANRVQNPRDTMKCSGPG